MNSERGFGEIRRVVTGFDENNKSVVKSDTILEPTLRGKNMFSTIWASDSSPANVLDSRDGRDIPLNGLTVPNGTVIRYIDCVPGGKTPLHLTRSLDYVIVLSGELRLLLDDGSETILKAGDTVVNRGISHAWAVAEGTEHAKAVFIHIDAEKFKVGDLEVDGDVYIK